MLQGVVGEVLGSRGLAVANRGKQPGRWRDDSRGGLYETAGCDAAERQFAAIAFAGVAGKCGTGGRVRTFAAAALGLTPATRCESGGGSRG